MSYHIARMVAYILQAQEGSDREAFNKLAKSLFNNLRRIMVARYYVQNHGLQNILSHVREKVSTRMVLVETVENLLNDIMTVNRNISSIPKPFNTLLSKVREDKMVKTKKS